MAGLTAKQERFAQNIGLKNMSQVAAYAEAYDTTKMSPGAVETEAGKLARHPLIVPRIAVLSEGATRAAVKAAAYTIDAAMAEADEARLMALAEGQTSAAVAAVKLRAQLGGHLVEKKADAKGALEDMDLERLLELKKAVEDKVERSREALAMVDQPAPVAAPTPIRRVI